MASSSLCMSLFSNLSFTRKTLFSSSSSLLSIGIGKNQNKSLILLKIPFSSSILPKPSLTPTTTFKVFAAKGYKMKTHKASAKRFRVTGKGKIVRRRAGKQHLLAKKNTKRKLHLSTMHPVDRSDYDNVIAVLPYLKVKRKAT